MFGEYTLFTSNIEAMENLHFFRFESSRRNAKIESAPLALLEYYARDRIEVFKGLNPYTFRFLIRG